VLKQLSVQSLAGIAVEWIAREQLVPDVGAHDRAGEIAVERSSVAGKVIKGR